MQAGELPAGRSLPGSGAGAGAWLRAHRVVHRRGGPGGGQAGVGRRQPLQARLCAAYDPRPRSLQSHHLRNLLQGSPQCPSPPCATRLSEEPFSTSPDGAAGREGLRRGVGEAGAGCGRGVGEAGASGGRGVGEAGAGEGQGHNVRHDRRREGGREPARAEAVQHGHRARGGQGRREVRDHLRRRQQGRRLRQGARLHSEGTRRAWHSFV
eukprot:scaffold66_cov233-Pinguiococcus_pyrenoidosus.AAC.4